jgi:hypothetical protein
MKRHITFEKQSIIQRKQSESCCFLWVLHCLLKVLCVSTALVILEEVTKGESHLIDGMDSVAGVRSVWGSL